MLQHALTETLGREWETEKYVGLGEKAAGRVSSLFPIHTVTSRASLEQGRKSSCITERL